MGQTHTYTLGLQWKGLEKSDSVKNDRLYQIDIAGKPSFLGSADRVFHGDASLYNPEDLLIASLAACHMMSYFYLCRKEGIKILDYRDSPVGKLTVHPNGSGKFEEVVLMPVVTVTSITWIEKAIALHDAAGKLCFIANSLNFPVIYEPKVLVLE